MAFPLFPKLPTELRLKIWNLSLPDSREFGPIGPTGADSQPNTNVAEDLQPCYHEIPALQVSHESRRLALQHLTRVWDDGSAKVIYVNYAIDTFTFTSIDYLLHLVRRSGLMGGGGPFPSAAHMSNMAHIKIMSSIQSLCLHLRLCLERVLSPFGRLQEIVVAVMLPFEGNFYRHGGVQKLVGATIGEAERFAGEILEGVRAGMVGEKGGVEWKVPGLRIEEFLMKMLDEYNVGFEGIEEEGDCLLEKLEQFRILCREAQLYVHELKTCERSGKWIGHSAIL